MVLSKVEIDEISTYLQNQQHRIKSQEESYELDESENRYKLTSFV